MKTNLGSALSFSGIDRDEVSSVFDFNQITSLLYGWSPRNGNNYELYNLLQSATKMDGVYPTVVFFEWDELPTFLLPIEEMEGLLRTNGEIFTHPSHHFEKYRQFSEWDKWREVVWVVAYKILGVPKPLSWSVSDSMSWRVGGALD